MLKNLSDYISLLTLIVLTAECFRIFLVFILNRQIVSQSSDKWQLIRDYVNNEEE